MDTKLDKNHKSFRKPRIKSNYNKITNEAREKLVEMVYLQNFLLKDAAKLLNINYSTAKTIIRIFRKEKRMKKKNFDQDTEIKQMINDFNENDYINSINNRLFEDDAISAEDMLLKNSNMSHKDDVKRLNIGIQKMTDEVNRCYESIKINQQMINNMMILSVKLNEKMCPDNDEFGKYVKKKIKEGLDNEII